MVEPSEEAVLRFQKTFKEQYGKDYSYEEAREAFCNLVGFYELLYKIDREQKLNAKENKSKN